jgi:hypothetical protein
MPLLTVADYQEIREVIDVTLTEDELPNDQIARDAFVGQAQRMVLARDPNAETRVDDEAARVRLAAIYYAAALVCPTIPVLTSVRSANETIQRQGVDMKARAAELKALAALELDAVVATGAASQPFAFGLAHGTRGR